MEPSISSCAYRMPSTRFSFWLITDATSSVGVDVAAAHFQKVRVIGRQRSISDDGIGIVDLADRRDRVGTVMRADNQRLRLDNRRCMPMPRLPSIS